MRILAFAASTREGSLNRRLIALASQIAREAEAEVELVDFRELRMPLYDGDVDAANGLPLGALELVARLRRSSGVMIASPEYNYSISGVLKNAIDWASRARPMPWRGKSIYLLSASPSAMGGVRGLWQTRIPLEGCGALVFPDMFALPNAGEAFDENGRLRSGTLADKLQKDIVGFVRFAEAVAPICDGQPVDKSRRDIIAALEEESELQPH